MTTRMIRVEQRDPDPDQLTLTEGPKPRLSISERFKQFHADNPDVYTGLVRLARQAKARGHHRIGIELLFAVLRWEMIMTTVDQSSDYKLNDHYTSRYARLIMEQNPDLGGIFEIRELRST